MEALRRGAPLYRVLRALKPGTTEANVQVGVDFLLWMCNHPDASFINMNHIKYAINYLVACCNIQLVQQGALHRRIEEGVFNTLAVRNAKQDRKKRIGETIVEGKGVRADHTPTYDEQVQMMELALNGDPLVKADPFRVLQVGAEYRLASMTGVRGERRGRRGSATSGRRCATRQSCGRRLLQHPPGEGERCRRGHALGLGDGQGPAHVLLVILGPACCTTSFMLEDSGVERRARIRRLRRRRQPCEQGGRLQVPVAAALSHAVDAVARHRAARCAVSISKGKETM